MSSEQFSMPHRVTQDAILDCLVEDSAGVMPLYRDIVARTGQGPDIEAFLTLLSVMCDNGVLEEVLPEGMTREQAFKEYQATIPLLRLADLTADTIGMVYIPTPKGHAEWKRWAHSFN